RRPASPSSPSKAAPTPKSPPASCTPTPRAPAGNTSSSTQDTSRCSSARRKRWPPWGAGSPIAYESALPTSACKSMRAAAQPFASRVRASFGRRAARGALRRASHKPLSDPTAVRGAVSGVRIIVRDVRSAEGWHDAERERRRDHRATLHGPVVGVEDELFALDAVVVADVAHHARRELRALAHVLASAHDAAAPHVEDEVDVQNPPARGGRQVRDVPAPGLVQAGRLVHVTSHDAPWIASAHAARSGVDSDAS